MFRNKAKLIVFLFAIVFAVGVISADGSSGVTQRSKQEIINYLKNSSSVDDEVTFSVTPVKNTETGKLSSDTLQSSLNYLNNIRYIAGLDLVTLDTANEAKAQAGSFVMWSTGVFDHHPEEYTTKPDDMSQKNWDDGIASTASSNISWGSRTLNHSILSCSKDASSASNVKTVGHRMWLLNPGMGKVSFGAARSEDGAYNEKYYNTYVMDSSGTGTQTNVAWPARYMPIEYFGNNVPWSFATGDPTLTDVSDVTVKLTRRSTSPSGSGSWTFSTDNTYTASTTGEYFGYNENIWSIRGQRGPYVIFRPADIEYEIGDIFDVKITGLGASEINYIVEFIGGYPVESISLDEEYRVTSSRTAFANVVPSSSSGYKINWSVADESVATVNSNGYITAVSPGETTLTARIDGKYTSDGHDKTATTKIIVPKDLRDDDVSISINSSYEYTGKEIKPIPVVVIDGKQVQLQEDVDYTAAYSRNIEVTTQYYSMMQINGINRYSGYSVQYFIISRANISTEDKNARVTGLQDYQYTGQPIIPDIDVWITLGGEDRHLIKDTDYTVQFSNNTKVGNATVKITGKGNFTGTINKTFAITEKDINDAIVTNIPAESIETGAAITPNPTVTINLGGVNTTLVKGTDYTVSYSNNVNAGTATVTITGKGNYKGTINRQFIILHNLSYVQPVSATCENAGNIGHYKCDKCGHYFDDAAGDNEISASSVRIAPLGHNWGSPTYTWSSDNKKVTASHTCLRDGSHSESEVVNSTSSVTKYANCTEPGERTYTASFTQDAFETQTKKTDINPLGHNWGTPSYTWNPDGAVTARRICGRDDSHAESETQTPTVDETPATCSKEGSATYTVRFENPAFVEQSKKETISKVPHTWDNSIPKEILVEGSCEKSGRCGYRCSVCGEIVEETISIIPAIGHEWDRNPVYTWTGTSKVTASMKCLNDPSHKFTETVTTTAVTIPPTYTSKGSTTYTAEFMYSYFETQTKTVLLDMLRKEIAKTSASINDVTYNGKAQTPALTVKDGGSTLKAGTDYTATYKNNLKAGTATVTITGKGSYTGTKTATFKINPASIAKATVSGITDKTYTGKAQTQSPTVKLGTTMLRSGTDYTISYKDNVNVGTATVTITGKGNYSGSVKKTFVIKANNYKATWKRLWGEKALDTMAAITKEFGKSNVAIVARFDKWEDALTAASLAGKYNAPVLMTSSTKLSGQTKSELKRMGVKTVYVLGSKSDVSDGVMSQIKAAGVKTVERIDGKTPSARAIAASNAIGKADRSNTVIIATHSGFYDALSVSPFAYASKSPIIYTESNKKLSDAAVKHIKGGGFKYALIVGGPAAIPAGVETQLNNAGIKSGNITRLAGERAYQTSLIIAEWATGKLKNGTGAKTGKLYKYASIKFQPTVKMAPTYVGVATGKDYYDALAGAALCGKHKGVLLLADDTNSSNTSFTKANKGKILQGYVFGGTAAVSKKVYDAYVKSTK